MGMRRGMLYEDEFLRSPRPSPVPSPEDQERYLQSLMVPEPGSSREEITAGPPPGVPPYDVFQEPPETGVVDEMNQVRPDVARETIPGPDVERQELDIPAMPLPEEPAAPLDPATRGAVPEPELLAEPVQPPAPVPAPSEPVQPPTEDVLASLVAPKVPGQAPAQDQSSLLASLLGRPKVAPEYLERLSEAEGASDRNRLAANIGGGAAQMLKGAVGAEKMDTSVLDNLVKQACTPTKHAERIGKYQVDQEKAAQYARKQEGDRADKAADRDLKRELAKMRIQDTRKRAELAGKNMSPAEKKVETEFGKSYTKFMLDGGFADAQKGFHQIKDVIQELKKPNSSLTGTLVGNTPDLLLQWTNPDALNARETVEEVVQRNLRLVLGAQFTENEGKRLIARAYNPRMSPEKNAVRLQRLMDSMQRAMKVKIAAAQYYEEHGMIKGFKGSEFSHWGQWEAAKKSEFRTLVDSMDSAGGSEMGMSPEQVAEASGVDGGLTPEEQEELDELQRQKAAGEF